MHCIIYKTRPRCCERPFAFCDTEDGSWSNVCPQDCPDWLFYDYFPESLVIDLEDFWPPESITAELNKAGFVAVAVEREHLRFEQDLRAWFDEVRRRATCSQLLAISDPAYEAGLRRLTEELAAERGPLLRKNHICLVTIRGGKPLSGERVI